MKIISIFLFITGILYPFIIYFLNSYLWLFFLLFSILWLIKFILICNNKNIVEENYKNEFVKILKSYTAILNNKYVSLSLFLLFLLMFFIKFMEIKNEEIIYLYPTLIYIIFFIIFIYNIKEKPIIISFAEIEHKIRKLPPLNIKEKKYTLILTYIWACFFLISAVLSIILSLLENKIYWLFYTGVLGYFLIGALFIIERLFRYKIIKIIK